MGDPASIKLMGYSQIVRGHVGSIARGINVANAQPNGQGLANVNPIFTWVRLAQRIPVRIHIDQVPEGVVLAAGMTATVQIDPQPRSRPSEPRPVIGRVLQRELDVEGEDPGVRICRCRAGRMSYWTPRAERRWGPRRLCRNL